MLQVCVRLWRRKCVSSLGISLHSQAGGIFTHTQVLEGGSHTLRMTPTNTLHPAQELAEPSPYLQTPLMC